MRLLEESNRNIGGNIERNNGNYIDLVLDLDPRPVNSQWLSIGDQNDDQPEQDEEQIFVSPQFQWARNPKPFFVAAQNGGISNHYQNKNGLTPVVIITESNMIPSAGRNNYIQNSHYHHGKRNLFLPKVG